MTNPIAYVDAATLMRGRRGWHADQGDRRDVAIAITAGDASLVIFTAFVGKLGMKLEDVQLIGRQSTVEGAGDPQQASRCAARLLHGSRTGHAATDRRENPIHWKAKFLEEINKSFRLAHDLRLLHDLAPPIHNANAREFQRDVDSDIVFHGCPPSPDAWGRLTSAPVSSSIGETATFTPCSE
jgi:hypothetical protein